MHCEVLISCGQCQTWRCNSLHFFSVQLSVYLWGFLGISMWDEEQVLCVQHFNVSTIFLSNSLPSHSEVVACWIACVLLYGLWALLCFVWSITFLFVLNSQSQSESQICYGFFFPLSSIILTKICRHNCKHCWSQQCCLFVYVYIYANPYTYGHGIYTYIQNIILKPPQLRTIVRKCEYITNPSPFTNVRKYALHNINIRISLYIKNKENHIEQTQRMITSFTNVRS